MRHLQRLNFKIVGLIGLMVTVLVISLFLAQQIFALDQYSFDSDEALHATRGLTLAFDLRRGDIAAFLRHSNSQSVYPPGSSWLEALVFLVFGPSIITARMYSLAALVGATLVMYALGLEIDKKMGWLIGLVAVLLTLTSQAVLLNATLAMLEMPGLLISLATILAYMRAAKHNSKLGFVVTSLLLVLTVLIKYPYGIVTLGAIGLTELIRIITDRTNLRFRALANRWIWLFLPFILLMFAWFESEDKVSDFFYYATLQPKQTDWYSLENLIYYPRSFMLHYTPSPILAIASVAGLVWAFFQWRKEEIRLILLYCIVGFFLMTLKESNSPRFILTIGPAVHLLTGAMCAWLANSWRQKDHKLRRPVIITAVILIIMFLASVPMVIERFKVLPILLAVEYETDPQANQLTEWIAEQTDDKRLYFINPWDQFSTYAMEWHQATSGMQHGYVFGNLFVPDTRLKNYTDERAEQLEFQMRFYSTDYVVALEGGREGHQNWPQYEQSFKGILELISTKEVQLDYYDLGNWLAGSLVTRRSLEQAKEEHHQELLIRARIYKLLD